jgi:Ino eighty subunit 2
MDTINRLLKKQAPKRRGKLSAAELSANGAGAGSDADATPPEVEKANPVFVKWVSDARGCRLGVPEEWVEAGVLV